MGVRSVIREGWRVPLWSCSPSGSACQPDTPRWRLFTTVPTGRRGSSIVLRADRYWTDCGGTLLVAECAVGRPATLAKLLISQTARWLGCVFLVLEVGGQLPGFFAYPAAFGDITIGVSACVAVIALIWSTSTSVPVAWSVLGLLDFVGAVGTGFLATQALALVHTDPPTSVFTQWPLVLFPAYTVPFSIILHITTIRVLLANPSRARDERTSVATSVMTASG